jgi:hypothetical protein
MGAGQRYFRRARRHDHAMPGHLPHHVPAEPITDLHRDTPQIPRMTATTQAATHVQLRQPPRQICTRLDHITQPHRTRSRAAAVVLEDEYGRNAIINKIFRGDALHPQDKRKVRYIRPGGEGDSSAIQSTH